MTTTAGTAVAADAESELMAAVRVEVGATGPRHTARHAVGQTAITDWCDAIGDANPCYLDPAHAAGSVHGGLVAPAAMLDVWDRPGLPAAIGPRVGNDPRSRVIATLERAGFTSVVAVNSELELRRYVRPGELLGNVQVLEDVSLEKRTGLGVGHFVTSRHRYTNADGEHVGDLLFRILKFKPGTGRSATAAVPPEGARRVPDPDPARRPRPAINRDNQFFWAGARAHELRIQRCDRCGALFSPPTPRCWHCGSFSLGHTVASGRGSLYSYAVVHHPAVDGFRYPLPVGLVELAEGTRLVAEIVGCDRADLTIGMPLELCWLDSHPAQVGGATDSRGPVALAQFRPAPPGRRPDTLAAGDVEAGHPLPLWSIPLTPTLTVAGAVATRDFTLVHHDRDHAVRSGSADIFLNINTSVGLLERYVTDALGPDLLVRALRVRLGAPAYPYDSLVFTGSVAEVDQVTGRATVAVRGRTALGDHVTGGVEIVLPGGTEYRA